MKDMENHFFKKSKTRYLTPSLFSHGLFTAPHRDPRAPRQCHWQATTEGRTGGAYRRSRRGSHALRPSLAFHIPQGPGKGAGGGENSKGVLRTKNRSRQGNPIKITQPLRLKHCMKGGSEVSWALKGRDDTETG